jgi:hypothetical protein
VKSPVQGIYDREIAAALLGGAAAAYGNEAAIAGWAARQGCTGCEVIRDGTMDTLVFVAAADEFAVVSFRGTTDLRNWLTDLECKLQSAECRVRNAEWGMLICRG